MGITRQQALDCFDSDDLIGIGMEADAIRRTLHPEGVATYVINRPVCLTAGDAMTRIDEALDIGATGITLRGHLPTLDVWMTLLASLRTAFPSLWLHGLSATEVVNLAAGTGLSFAETLNYLQAAGLNSLAGDDAGILDQDLHLSARCSPSEWLAVHRAAHLIGLPSTATMRFGTGETPEHRLNHLKALHDLQQETGGFVSFRPTAAAIPGLEEPTAVEYLKTLAITRMVLDNIPHIEADWPSQGLKVLQMTLRFGANDVGSTLYGEALTSPDGTTEEDLRRVIRGAGLRPVQRDTGYRMCLLG